MKLNASFISENACAIPDKPSNGYTKCATEGNEVRCSIGCDNGYAFAMTPVTEYSCDSDVGEWLPADKMPFPDCAGRVKPVEIKYSQVNLD